MFRSLVFDGVPNLDTVGKKGKSGQRHLFSASSGQTMMDKQNLKVCHDSFAFDVPDHIGTI